MPRGDNPMYVDEYVIAGLIIVALTIGFFGGVYRFIKLDMAKYEANKKSEHGLSEG